MAAPTKSKVRPKFKDCPTPFSDHVFKVAHGVEVPLRVWPATAGEGPRPWMIWFHGGGFTFGKHYHPNPWVLPAFRSRGYHVVSAAYRFLPHVSLWDVVDDSQDAFAWCRRHLAEAVGKLGGVVDIDRYVVAGDSMGGLLVTLAGHNFSPRPRALACMYPFTHPEDEYFHPGKKHPFRKFLRVGEPGADVISDEVEKARANLGGAVGDTLAPMHPDILAFVGMLNAQYEQIQADPEIRKGDSTLVNAPLSWTYSPLELYTLLSARDPKAATVAAPFKHELPPVLAIDGLRAYWGMPPTWTPKHPSLQWDAMVFQYAARMMIRVGGRRELYGSDEEWFRVLHSISAIEITKERARLLPPGQKLEYPPTFLIHGTIDDTVPCYHSKKLAAELKAAGVPVQERYAVGELHNFDLDIIDSSNPKWKQFIEPCMDFVDRHVWEDRPSGAVSSPATRSRFLAEGANSRL